MVRGLIDPVLRLTGHRIGAQSLRNAHGEETHDAPGEPVRAKPLEPVRQCRTLAAEEPSTWPCRWSLHGN
jgi:hypothetical protein